ncbi:MAG: PhzF family phenazine biosynthesis isomerase [Candidatus Heimdallarchaeota archaeon]|nr:PhzF family phenazine biosynthesis isomerase [Candidatus Heimdallarchaeota archaeon]
MPIYQVDAFTDKPYNGNPTAVVLDADDLTQKQKQNFAREINLSVSTFVSKSDKANFKVEFYSPRMEMNISGHGTIATFWVLAKLGLIKPETDITRFTQESKEGIHEIEIFWKEEQLEKVMMVQKKPIFTKTNVSKKELADILGIRSDKIISKEKLPVTIASTGNPKLLIPIANKEMTDALVPKFDALERLCRRLKITGVHLYTFDTYLEGTNCYTRHFAPLVGVPENPVSGMANAALGAFLVKQEFFPAGRLIIEQGESLLRPGKVEVEIETKNKKITTLKIGGKSKIIFKLTLEEEM